MDRGSLPRTRPGTSTIEKFVSFGPRLVMRRVELLRRLGFSLVAPNFFLLASLMMIFSAYIRFSSDVKYRWKYIDLYTCLKIFVTAALSKVAVGSKPLGCHASNSSLRSDGSSADGSMEISTVVGSLGDVLWRVISVANSVHIWSLTGKGISVTA